MTCTSRAGGPARPVLSLVPPAGRAARPPLTRWQRRRAWYWRLRGEVSYWLQFTVLAAVVRRVATRGFRERAWVAGFEHALGARDREGFWAPMACEYEAGHAAGSEAAMPMRAGRDKLPAAERARRPRALARAAGHLPVTRARLAREAARHERHLSIIIDTIHAASRREREPAPARRAPLVLVRRSAWEEPS